LRFRTISKPYFSKQLMEHRMENDPKISQSSTDRFEKTQPLLSRSPTRRVPLPHLAAAPPELLQQFLSPIPRIFFALLMQRV